MTNLQLTLADISCFIDFRQATQAVLQFLHHRLGFQLWAFTRVEGENQILLVTHDHGYGANTGDVVDWGDSICARMVKGQGPEIAPDVEAIPAYASAPIRQSLPSCAYVGIALYFPNGTLFGTLCAIDPNPQPEQICQELPLIKLQARLLSTLLQHELSEQDKARRQERVKLTAQLDALTGLYNRQAWDQLVALEEARCQRYGNLVGIIAVGLGKLNALAHDSSTDSSTAAEHLLLQAAIGLRQATEASDFVARLDADEFGILITEPTFELMQRYVTQIQQSLAKMGLSAFVGWAIHSPKVRLSATVEQAQHRMRQKQIMGVL